MPTIKFGTSGWRAILADEFTFPNVKVAVQAIADHLKAEKQAKKGVITEEVSTAARAEHVPAEKLSSDIAAGLSVIARNRLRDIPPLAIGRGLSTKVNANIGTSKDRDSLDEEELMEPGAVYQFTVRLYPTSNVLKKGHRIRLDISSSNFPRFDVNPNTGGALGLERRRVVATNTIYHDSSRPSHVILPLVDQTDLTRLFERR